MMQHEEHLAIWLDHRHKDDKDLAGHDPCTLMEELGGTCEYRPVEECPYELELFFDGQGNRYYPSVVWDELLSRGWVRTTIGYPRRRLEPPRLLSPSAVSLLYW